MILHKTKIDKE